MYLPTAKAGQFKVLTNVKISCKFDVHVKNVVSRSDLFVKLCILQASSQTENVDLVSTYGKEIKLLKLKKKKFSFL